MNHYPADLPLGKSTEYVSQYDPQLLCPFPRQAKRDEIGVQGELPFSGCDLWNGYELSWLNDKGLPQVAMARFNFPCSSPFLIESKSFKLYLNSFNQTRLESWAELEVRLAADLAKSCGAPVLVELFSLAEAGHQMQQLPGVCLDEQDIEIADYQLRPEMLQADTQEIVSERLHSHLLKSNCLVTSQPDWGSVMIRYQGGRIDRAALLRYLISFRQHNEFHEQCVERIFSDLLRTCQPEKLTVYARYTRRGGLDINPFRSNFEATVENLRLARQ